MLSRYFIILTLLICFFVPSFCGDVNEALRDQEYDKVVIPQVATAFVLSLCTAFEMGMDIFWKVIFSSAFAVCFYYLRAAIPFHFGNLFLDNANDQVNSIFKNFGSGIYLLLMFLINSMIGVNVGWYNISINVYTIFTLSILYLTFRGGLPQFLFGEQSGIAWLVIINILSIVSEYRYGKNVLDPLEVRALKMKSVFFTIFTSILTFIVILLGYGYGIDHALVVNRAVGLVATLNIIRLLLYETVLNTCISFGILISIPLFLDMIIFKSRGLCAVKCQRGHDAMGYCKSPSSPDAMAVCPIDISGHFYLGLVIITGLSRSFSGLWAKNLNGWLSFSRYCVLVISALFIIVLIPFLTKTLTTRHSIFDKIAGAFLGIAVGIFTSSEKWADISAKEWIVIGFSLIFFVFFGFFQGFLLKLFKDNNIAGNDGKLKIGPFCLSECKPSNSTQ